MKPSFHKSPYWTILFIALTTPITGFGQDTISVYFEFGSAKISNKQQVELDFIRINYDISSLDSILYLGMADSVGNFKTNLRLSEKRARNIARYCEKLIPKTIPSKVVALGEKIEGKEKESRRVDIIFYYKGTNEAQGLAIGNLDSSITDNPIPLCYYIDYSLLHRSHVRTITKGKKRLVMIEALEPQKKNGKTHYSGSIDKSGILKLKKVRWKNRVTGSFWWLKQRPVALIPEKNFDQFRIFTIDTLPCDTCNEDFANTSKITNQEPCLQVDRFLMRNLQCKTNWFKSSEFKIRVPKEYVDIKDKYYIGCGHSTRLHWETKKWGKRKNYYFTKLPIVFLNMNYIANITRDMECCKTDPEPSDCNKGMIGVLPWFCIPRNQDYRFVARAGVFYPQKTFLPFLGLGISKAQLITEEHLFIGVDLQNNLFASLEFDLYLLSFPWQMLSPFSNWQTPGPQLAFSNYAEVYVGSELRGHLNLNSSNNLYHTAHIGLCHTNAKPKAILNRIYLQSGIGFDYLDSNPFKSFGVAQFGIDLSIASFN